MDTDSGRGVPSGGTIEPANRAQVARQVFQMPTEPPGTRYELRDPFAETTFRAKTFDEMAAKADQLGAIRFAAVDKAGSRTLVTKVDGRWVRPGERDVSPPALRQEGVPDRATPPLSATAAPKKSAPEIAAASVDLEAERAARVARLEAGLQDRYVIKRPVLHVGDLALGATEYRYRGDANRLAFTETTFRLATDHNNPSVARSMVDVAEARGWNGVRVSGNEDFKRQVWMEASLRGVKAVGYEPNLGDQELLLRERDARSVNRIEPVAREAGRDAPSTSDATGAKTSSRGGGRKAVLAALEAVLVDKGVPAKQREAVMASAAENLARRVRAGEVHKVKVYDGHAPSPQTRPTPNRDLQRAPDRSAPVR